MDPTPVIVTRSEPGAAETAAHLEAMGLHPVVSPAIELVSSADVELPDLSRVSGLVFTSANGVRFFIQRSNQRHFTAWCVGPATADAARSAGFLRVEESNGDAGDLAQFILKSVDRSSLPLLHVANAAAKGNLKATLERAGQSVIFCPLYKAETASELAPQVAKLLSEGISAALLVHSEKGARAFLHLAEGRSLSDLTGIAISPTVAKVLTQAGLKRTHIAKAPNESELLNALQNAVSELRR